MMYNHVLVSILFLQTRLCNLQRDVYLVDIF